MTGEKRAIAAAARPGARMDVTTADVLVLLAIVVALFAADLLVATLRPRAVGFREAALWSVFFTGRALPGHDAPQVTRVAPAGLPLSQ